MEEKSQEKEQNEAQGSDEEQVGKKRKRRIRKTAELDDEEGKQEESEGLVKQDSVTLSRY